MPLKKRVTRPRKKPVARSRRMRLEAALKHLRNGKSIRRESWQAGNRIFRVDENVFVMFAQPDVAHNLPKNWEPYPQDFLAEDWVIFDKAPVKIIQSRRSLPDIYKSAKDIIPRY